MDQLLKVGNDITKESSDNLKDLITTIFKSGYENRMEQSTIVTALQVISNITEIKQITISHCNFKSKEGE